MNDELRVKDNELGGKMNYRYRTDEEMKDSGVEWLDVIPKSWTRNKLKRELKFSVGSTPSTSNRSFFEGENIWVTIGDLNGKYCSESKTKLTEEALRSANMKKVPKGSLLYSFKLSVGQVAFTEKDLYTNEAIASFYPNNNSNLDFWYYALGNYLIENSNENIYGAKLLNQELINNANIFVPSEEEQKKIAKFLDKKTAEFDCIISKKETLIEKLEEAKKSLISEVVTGKVKVVKTNDGYELVERKKEEMKDSGVEWLGDIPKEWLVKRIKYLLMECRGKSEEGLEEPLSMSQKYGLIKTSDMDNIPNQALSLVGNKIVCKNDLVFNKLKPHLGVFSVSKYNGIVSPDYAVYRAKEKVNIKYLEYLFKTPLYIREFKKYATGIGAGLTRLYTDQLFNIQAISPSYSEQENIVIMINRKLEETNMAIEKMKNQIEKLKEAKQSLISEAVTGKIEILD